MRLVPVSLLARGQFNETDHAAFRDATLKVGTRYEVDVDLLQPQLRERVLDETAHPGPETRIKLQTAIQSTSKNKIDLVREYEALCEVGGVSEVLRHATEAVPNLEAIETACILTGATLLDPEPLKLRFTLPPTHLPEALGGVAVPGEVRREVEVGFNHAPWRDRRVRRLTRVECYAVIS